MKNASRRGVLTPTIKLWSFGSLGGLPSPHFGSVNVILTLFQMWSCDNNLVISLESMSTKDVDLQLIVARLLHKVSKRKECESSKTTALVNKTHKSNEKLCFYYKKPGHFVRNCLKKKNDEKKGQSSLWRPPANVCCRIECQWSYHLWLDCRFWCNATHDIPIKMVYHIWTHFPRRVFMGDDTVLEAIGKGNIKAIVQVWGELSHTTITQVLHVPKMKNNIISVSKLISKGFKVEYDKDGCKVNDV